MARMSFVVRKRIKIDLDYFLLDGYVLSSKVVSPHTKKAFT